MSENNPPDVPQAPKLSDLPDPFAEMTPKPQSNEETVKEETEKFIGALPSELRDSLRGFYRNLTKTIVAQETRAVGEKTEVIITPVRIRFYKDRLNEILKSGFLNPHEYPPKKIV